ncbi:DsbA family protein [Aestuariivita boseongensis]|uniref:DsbA family protein n=1 Tax=Aestuariivita boseongensis TaxID=1470562 RepID=UPI000680E731|nr:DsbA family protein [Aestuariivita boseongensis]
MNRRHVLLSSAALIAAGGYVLTRPSGTNAVDLPGAAHAQDLDIDTSGIMEMQLGNPDAPVTVIEYASYTCPHCARFHEGAFKQLKADYIDTGKINFIYREVYFDRFGLWASMIARCGENQQRFFGITEIIYELQSEWSRAGSPPQIADELRKIGRLAGIENDALEACLQDQEMAQTLVAWYQQNSIEHGIQSTPSFVINGRTYTNMAYDEFSSLIDEAMGS